MANVDRPHGASCISPHRGEQPYDVDSGYGTALFKGDIIVLTADGNIEAAAAGDNVAGTSRGIIGATSDYSDASTAKLVSVADNPFQQYNMQDDAAATGAQTTIGQNCDHVAGAGSTKTLMSAHELGFGSLGTATAGFRILDLIARSDNSAGNNADWRCVVNEYFTQTTTGI